MIEAIKAFVNRRILPPPDSTPAGAPSDGRAPVQLAACALLLELAHADDEFSPAERSHIEAALQHHFELDEATTRELIELAQSERQQAIDHYQFARTITQHYDLGQRMVLAEVMWGVILADGEIARHESHLILAPAYLSQARRSAAPPA